MYLNNNILIIGSVVATGTFTSMEIANSILSVYKTQDFTVATRMGYNHIRTQSFLSHIILLLRSCVKMK